jgi:hypothetical protein
MDIISFGRLRPDACGKGHLGDQSQGRARICGNRQKNKGLAVEKAGRKGDSISTRTSKDYFLQSLKVNFAGFSIAAYRPAPLSMNKKNVGGRTPHACNPLKLNKLFVQIRPLVNPSPP